MPPWDPPRRSGKTPWLLSPLGSSLYRLFQRAHRSLLLLRESDSTVPPRFPLARTRTEPLQLGADQPYPSQRPKLPWLLRRTAPQTPGLLGTRPMPEAWQSRHAQGRSNLAPLRAAR